MGLEGHYFGFYGLIVATIDLNLNRTKDPLTLAANPNRSVRNLILVPKNNKD